MTDRRMSPRVGVLFGGKSGEHEVSLMSARTVMAALDKAGYEVIPIGISPAGHWLVRGDPMARLATGHAEENGTAAKAADGAHPPVPFVAADEKLPTVDIIFPVLHGPYGEDGTVQGLLEMAGLPYVGCSVLASAVGMDKVTSKQIMGAQGLPQAAYQSFLRRDWRRSPEAVLDRLEATLTYPLFVKPANLGSSVGISKAKHRQGLVEAIELACAYDRKLVVEQAVPMAREIEVSVLGNDDPIASVPGEVVPCNEFYDYAAKYLDDRSQLLVPAPISADLAAEFQRLAIKAFRALDCAGLARVDFLLSDSGEIYLNELNTMPGFTHASMYPRLWEASGIPLPELVQRLVELALERHEDRQQNRIARQ